MKKNNNNIFLKNGEIHLGNLSVFCGFGQFKLSNAKKKIIKSATEEERINNQKQFDTLILGGIAKYAGITIEDILKNNLT